MIKKPAAPPEVPSKLNQRLDTLTKDRQQSECLVNSLAQKFLERAGHGVLNGKSVS